MRLTHGLAAAAAIPVLLAACGDSATDTTPAQSSDDSAMVDESTPSSEAMADESGDDAMTDDAMAEGEGDDAMTDDSMSDGEGDAMAEGDAMGDEMSTVTFKVTISNVSASAPIHRSGVFAVPSGSDGPGPLLPGSSYEATIYANPGESLSFATMFVQSNDWFVAPGMAGIPLYDADGNPVSGEISDMLYVWDAGTEADQPVGQGADQAPRQAGPDTGADDPDNTVRMVDGYTASEFVSVTLTPGMAGEFTLTITNISDNSMQSTPFAPGVWAVHEGENPLFIPGMPDPGNGLEALAEDGDPSALAAWLEDNSGLPTPLAPVVYVWGDQGNPLFTEGEPAGDTGLENLAEDGDPSVLAATVEGDVQAVPIDGTDPGPAFPGSGYEFEVEVPEGHTLSFATMFVQSNDWFLSPGEDGIAVFDSDGKPISGDVTDQVFLWDAGTEEDQVPGFGPDQAPRQSAPDTGNPDPDNEVREVGAAEGIIEVTITPVG
ncbi:MAG TPA: hypothetical protein ENI86_18240 [Acidimicrobiales bacterium]|nr:hypothetical protein [Acidimicrobiales bacterium]